jgi:hypothetical protein
MSGKGILNCALKKEDSNIKNTNTNFNNLIKRIDFSKDDLVNFNNDKKIKENIEKLCIKRSYFTQNYFFIDKSCPQNVCLNIKQEDFHHYRKLLPNKCRLL